MKIFKAITQSLKEIKELLNEINNSISHEANKKVIEYIKQNDLTNNRNYMDSGIGNIFRILLKILEVEVEDDKN